jgi:hypothetical protein
MRRLLILCLFSAGLRGGDTAARGVFADMLQKEAPARNLLLAIQPQEPLSGNGARIPAVAPALPIGLARAKAGAALDGQPREPLAGQIVFQDTATHGLSFPRLRSGVKAEYPGVEV